MVIYPTVSRWDPPTIGSPRNEERPKPYRFGQLDHVLPVASIASPIAFDSLTPLKANS